MNENIISIVLTVYNAERFIEKTIKSIIDQTFKKWELIIVDDCSTDNSVNLINSLIKNFDNISLIILKKNYGCNYARNLAINKSSGRWIAIIDHDDYWISNKLELQIEHHKKINCALSHTYYRRFNSDGNIGKLIKAEDIIDFKDLLKANTIALSSVMIDRKIVLNFQMFDGILSDFPTWLKILSEHKFAYVIKHDLLRYYYDKSTDSGNKFKAAINHWLVYRNYLKMPILKSFFYMICYIIKSFIKHFRL